VGWGRDSVGVEAAVVEKRLGQMLNLELSVAGSGRLSSSSTRKTEVGEFRG
jgi:hypothetical protein